MIVIAGKNSVAVNCLHHLIESKTASIFDVVALPVAADKGFDDWQPSLRLAAMKLGVQNATLEDVCNITNGVFVSLEYDKIIRLEQFQTSRLFNIHFSALPKFKGCWNSIQPILSGETESGVTLHVIDDGIDTGPIIDQTRFQIDRSETAFSLYEKFQTHGTSLFKRRVRDLIDGTYSTTPQPLENSTYFSRKSLNPKQTEIDFAATCFQIDQQVRAWYFPVFQMATFQGRTIEKTEVMGTGTGRKLGSLIESGARYADIQAVDGIIRLHFSK